VRGRSSPRIKVLCPAHFTTPEGDTQRFGTVVVINQAGLYLATSEPLEPGQEIDLAISLPGHGQAYRSRARVVERRLTVIREGREVPGIGCEFADPPGELVEAIRALPPL
jgi:Tfp pilus assembly protein PilZ